MKTTSILLLLILCIATSVFSQERKPDLIIKKDNSKIESIIQEIDKNTVKYKKFTDLKGPTFAVEKSEISSILYGNGEVEVIQENINTAINKLQKSTNVSKDKPIDISTLSTKKQKFLDTYKDSDSERLLSDMRRFKKKSTSGKIFGTILGTASIGVLATGIIKGISINSKLCKLTKNDYF